MSLPYTAIPPGLARNIKLVMTDVDGTLTSDDETIGADVEAVIRSFEDLEIPVGLVSGRTLPGLECLARRLGISGPIIAENGGVAKPNPDAAPLNMGYSRRRALEALARLKQRFPGSIRERRDNAERTIDVVFFADGVPPEALCAEAGDIQVMDSGYILHLMEPGISKGDTLRRLMEQGLGGAASPGEVLVFGDSATDVSLFELFPNNVLVLNPRLPAGSVRRLRDLAHFESGLSFGEGFVQVARHLLGLIARAGGGCSSDTAWTGRSLEC